MNAPSPRPNVLLILDDQHRFDYLGAAGASWVRTPNLDRLALEGTRFTNTYCNAPVCAPSRVGLATGILPHNLGALDNSQFLPLLTRRTYYQQLRDHGYHVGGVGKFDLAKSASNNGARGDRPLAYAWGFTHPIEIEGKMHAGKADHPRGPYGEYLRQQGRWDAFRNDYRERESNWALNAWDSVLPAEDWADAYIGQRSIDWLRSVPAEYPWHLFVSFVGPHDPFDPPTVFADKYRTAAMPDIITSDLAARPRWHAARQLDATPEQQVETRRQYCACIQAIDAQVGRIFDALASTGQRENTIIIFASDHGEMLGDHGMYQKECAYEPAWHVPMIAAGPGIPRGRTCDALIELNDLNPTICEVAGVPPVPNIDARSFATVLAGHGDTHRDHVLGTLRNFACVFDGRWKYVDNYNDRHELYDLHADPHEQHNRIDDACDEASRLARTIRRRLTSGQHLR